MGERSTKGMGPGQTIHGHPSVVGSVSRVNAQAKIRQMVQHLPESPKSRLLAAVTGLWAKNEPPENVLKIVTEAISIYDREHGSAGDDT